MTSDELVEWIAAQRWFRSKTRARSGSDILETIEIEGVLVHFVRIRFMDGGSETYVVPLTGDQDAFASGFADVLLSAVRDGRSFGALRSYRHGAIAETPAGRVGTAEQTNTTVLFGDRLIMKVYRKLETGENPEVEILRFLASQPSVPTPRLVGELEYQGAAVAMVQTFVRSRGDAWAATLGSIAAYLEDPRLLDAETAAATRLGGATAALHRALASSTDPQFVPEPLSDAQRDTIVANARESLDRLIRTLRTRSDLVQTETRAAVEQLLARSSEIGGRLNHAASMSFSTRRTRVHGDYHLGQVLVTPEGEYVIIDFEGEPARSLEERRAKSMPLRDVAGMLRSFDYAAVTALRASQPDHKEAIAAWKRATTGAFFDAWRRGVEGSAAAPASDQEARALLDLFLVEKGVYEVAYELDNRPGWLAIPVEGLLSLLDG